MKNLREKGITLVALVVTIIILLILAGVTLNIALSENGLFQRAKGAAKRYENASTNEQETLDNLDKALAELSGPTGGMGSSDVADNLKKYQGKYVDIGLDTNDNNKVDDWKIFYATDNRIFLISADYISTEKLEAWKVIGTDGKLDKTGFKESTLCTPYSVYWPNAPTQFLDLPDLNLVMHTGYSLETNKAKDNSKAVSQLLNKEAWSGIKDSATEKANIDFAIGGPTLEMWCSAWNKAVKNDTNGFVEIKAEEINTDGYYVSSNTSKDVYLYMNGITSSLDSDKLTVLETTYKTFFSHTSVYEKCSGYWLASPSAYASSNLMHVHYLGSLSTYDFNGDGLGVRPIVSLTSGVRLVETPEGSGKYEIKK